jgi:phage tail-like protein
MAENGNRAANLVTTNRFYVEIESNIAASFSECSGFSAKVKSEKHFAGGANDRQRVILGQVEYEDVTLKRGITDDLGFWNWVISVMKKPTKRRNINILLFNQAGKIMQCWTLIGAVPIAWKTPELKADANDIAIEELTLAYEGLQVSRSQGGGAIEGVTRHSSGDFIESKIRNGTR